jgi:hypothetical protein
MLLQRVRRRVVTGSRIRPNIRHRAREPGEAIIMRDSTQRTGTHLSIHAMRLVSAGMQ